MKTYVAANQAVEKKVRPLLRLSTAGSVDDGKSTLIGRLMFDAKGLFEDQLIQMEDKARKRGAPTGDIDLAAVTDGLRSEQEQGITIDVAYRYFATPRRKFIIADTPGHEQYTRNMVTGASTADCALVLVDAEKGPTSQTIRHLYIAVLLGIKNIVVVVNKMDRVDFSPLIFENMKSKFLSFTKKLRADTPYFIPISALSGDNVVDKSKKMPWYKGKSVLSYLENLELAAPKQTSFRLPIQYVIRPNEEFRGYAGRLSGGCLQKGMAIQVLPSGLPSQVTGIWLGETEIETANPGDSIVITIADHIDISRGDMIVSKDETIESGLSILADVVWMDRDPLLEGQRLLLKHGTRTVKAFISSITNCINVENLTIRKTDNLALNEIGRCKITLQSSVPIDMYEENRVTGSFIFINPTTNATAGAGMAVRIKK
jgi:sulfate adenylyltransferase large subunit